MGRHSSRFTKKVDFPAVAFPSFLKLMMVLTLELSRSGLFPPEYFVTKAKSPVAMITPWPHFSGSFLRRIVSECKTWVTQNPVPFLARFQRRLYDRTCSSIDFLPSVVFFRALV